MSRARAIRIFGVLGGLASLVLIASLFADPTRFLRSYLFSYLYWLSLGLGALPLLMIYHLTGGGWGNSTRRILESSLKTFPGLGLLFLPIVAGLSRLYSWSSRGSLPEFKYAYLNRPFFLARAAVVLACWGVLAWKVLRSRDTGRLRAWSAGGLVVYLMTATVFAIDWQMSLEPMHFSTIYGLVAIIEQGLRGWAFVLVVFACLSTQKAGVATLRDMGNLLLTLVILWAYLAFMEYLIVWSANLPVEVTWTRNRTHGGWQILAVLLAAFQFAAPFSALLLRPAKASAERLSVIAALVLATGVLECYWRVMPAFHPERIRIDWTDPIAFVAVGGLWLALFLWKLGSGEHAHA